MATKASRVMEDFPLERKFTAMTIFLSHLSILLIFKQQTNKYIQLTIVFSSRVDNMNFHPSENFKKNIYKILQFFFFASSSLNRNFQLKVPKGHYS